MILLDRLQPSALENIIAFVVPDIIDNGLVSSVVRDVREEIGLIDCTFI